MALKSILSVDNQAVPLNDFTQRYIAHILYAVASVLNLDSKKFSVYIADEEVSIYDGDEEVLMKKDFAKQLIKSTIKGMLSPLKGIFWLKQITITVFVVND